MLSPQGWEGSYIAANGSALVVGDEILYWYEAGDPFRIALARSRDGKNWTRHGDAVVPLGPRGSFDERAVADPYVIRAGGNFYMFYLGQDRARRQSLGIARSSDGVTWEKLRSNPILEPGAPGAFDENGVGEPAVWTSGGQWWMLYTGRDKGEQPPPGPGAFRRRRPLGTRPELRRIRIECMGQPGGVRSRAWSRCPTARSASGSAAATSRGPIKVCTARSASACCAGSSRC